MAEENIGLLLSVDLDASETLKTLAALRDETKQLRKEQKGLDTSTEEGRVEYERYDAQIKANTKNIQQYGKQVQNSIQQEVAKKGSIKSLRAELSSAKDAYAGMSKAEREGAKGKEVLEKTAALNAELKELEGSYGDNQRKVGEYENATKSLRTEVRTLTESLATMLIEGQDNTEEYKNMASRLAELKDAMGDVALQTNQMASDTLGFDTMVQGVQAVTASYNLWKTATTLLGIEIEELDKVMQKMVVAMGALQALTTLQNLAQKQSNIYRAIASVQQKLKIKQTIAETVATATNTSALAAETIAENAATVAKTKGAIASKLAAAGQWLWNAAMSANPIALLVVGIVAAIAGISALIEWMSKDSASMRDAAAAQEEYNKQLEKSTIEQERVSAKTKTAISQRQIAARKEIVDLKADGVTKEQLAAAEMKAAEDVRDIEIAASKEREAAARKNLAAARELAAAQLKARDELKEGSKRWRKYNDAVKETNASIRDHSAAVNDAFFEQKNLIHDQLDAENQAKDSRASDAKDRVDKAVSAYQKLIDEQRNFNEEALKAETGYLGRGIKNQQDYAQKIFVLNQNAEKAKLDNLRKYNKVTQAEYDQALGVMSNRLTAFTAKQVDDLNAYFEGERNAILGMLAKTLDEQIREIESGYEAAIKRLSSIEPPKIEAFANREDYEKANADYEAFALDQAGIAIRLESQKNESIKALQKTALASQIKQIEDTTKEQYSDDLVKFQNNERAKLDTTEKMLREQIEAKKSAGLDVLNEDAQLEALRLQRIGLNLKSELLAAGDNAQKRYDARKKALDAELDAAQYNADAILDINARVAENERQLFDARIAAAETWADAAGTIFSQVMELQKAQLAAQAQEIEDVYSQESEDLKIALSRKLISQADYDKKSEVLEKKKEKELAKIERQRAVRERAAKIFSIVTDTSMGIVKAVAALPLTGGLPFSAVVAAIGALNLATVLAEPLPKAARGGLISGPRHAKGGVAIEAEGGEAIMTRRAVSLFGPLLSAFNELGGGQPFAAPLSDGGYSLRRSSFDKGLSADELTDAIGNLKIYTVIEDINRGQAQFAQIQSRGSV